MYSNWLRKICANTIRQEFTDKEYQFYQEYNRVRYDYPRQAKTYYDSMVEEEKAEFASKQVWKPFFEWMQQVRPQVLQSGDQQFIDYFESKLSRLQQEINEPEHVPAAGEYESKIDEDIIKFYLDGDDLESLIPLFDKNNIYYDTITFPTGKEVFIFEPTGDMWVVEKRDDGSLKCWETADEWLNDVADYSHEYYPETDKSKEFWDGVGPGAYLYHATKEENLPSILKDGLWASHETRGLKNRDMPSAVFTVSDSQIDDLASVLDSYGDVIIRIDLGAMKQDGYMPDISGETPVEEAEIKGSLAHAIGYDTYEPYGDMGGDYMNDTIAIYGDIPAKYLKAEE